jgi:GTP-binding protein Era
MEQAPAPGEQAPPAVFRSGFAALLGRPNVGKSTLLNALLGERVAPTNPKPQTTRRRLRGILTTESYQLVFIDTPGYHVPKDNLGRYLVQTAKGAVTQADAVVVILDAGDLRPVDLELLETVREAGKPTLALLNKADLLAADAAPPGGLPELERGGYLFTSALTGAGLAEFVKRLAELMPPGPLYYDAEQVTAEPLRELAAEFIREAALGLLHQEVPYALEAVVENFKPRSPELTYISARLYVERASQVGIVVGRGGAQLRKIGFQARKRLEELLDTKVYLDLRVKVKPKWRKDENALREFGYRRKG